MWSFNEILPYNLIGIDNSESSYINIPFENIGYESSDYFFNFWQAQPRDDFEMYVYAEMQKEMMMDSAIEMEYYNWLQEDQLMNISVYNWYAEQANISLYINYKRKHECE
jgi:hypothetical protein